MNEDTGQLNESFTAHEHLAPDATDVLTRANEIARSYQRRRWAVRASGTAVLSAGVVAGGVAIPSLVGRDTNQTVTPLSESAGPAAGTDPASYTTAQEMDTFLTDGYTYQDAQHLAQLWNDDRAVNKIKAAAGLKLLEGKDLPIPPSGTPASPEDKGVSAFFAAGYSFDDAVTLAGMWHETDVYQVKAEAGRMLSAGEQLPIQPSPDNPAAPTASDGAAAKESLAAKKKMMMIIRARGGGAASTPSDPNPISLAEEQADQAFFAAGYTYDDAVQLGTLWHESDTNKVKADAGQKLLDGASLPVDPSGQPESKESRAVDAFFNAGYTYDDAVTLGQMWNEPNTAHVKADAGQKLLDGHPLPIQP
jgi:hypothetical protein